MFKNIITSKFSYFLLTFLYITCNLIILTRFPFVHSDETWLSGLSRNIMETKNYAVTETFFDLYPRNPHAIKSLFHTLQILSIKLMGYEILTIRLLSFLFGLLTLIWFYKLCNTLFNSKKWAFISTLFLSMDIQFVYASHFARQEIILLFIMLFSLNYFLSNFLSMKPIHHLFLGMIIGLSIGVHPNSFIICLVIVFLYLFHIVFTKKLKLSGLLTYAIPVGCFALGFIGLSLYFDANFIGNYTQYGSQFGVTNTLISKVSEIQNFYIKLYYGISGTYYTPDIRLEFCLFFIALAASIIFLFKEEQKKRVLILSIILAIVAVNLGIIVIGRFSQPSIIFLFPLFYILVTYVLIYISKKSRIYLALLLLLMITINTLVNVLPYLNRSYENYLQEIGKIVPKEHIVLANLNAEMYFENGKLYDYRNLTHLKEDNLTFEQYIQRNKISYIIYPDEMDFIFAYRPQWNNVYGDISLYYEDMQRFLRTKSQLVYEFTEPTYGMRIARYINQKDWKIKIYKVNE
ncbi:glycosyltransferase family 39 protein [Desulfitobacterium sp. PCE1]|uniref:ArnT family glycosyltransferase n=1 Tax=Desulfitobacterium sp. PCE1 TaxID=146907 RepID=UPI00036D5840|nr:glycosyltransferase family 39 protein [Desulfitobacterium sp. PCE1]